MELLKSLYSIYSPSGKETELIKFVSQYVAEHCSDVIIETDNYNNLYITKGISDTYPCLAAHTDQVKAFHTEDFDVVSEDGCLYGYSNEYKRKLEAGADDKNGIWIALRCLETSSVLKVVLLSEEEKGFNGARNCDMTFFEDCRFVLECDSYGSSEFCVTDDEGISYSSKEFEKDCLKCGMGYELSDFGSRTDVMILHQRGLRIAAANISVGYYLQHGDDEYTVVSELENALAYVKEIISKCTKVYTTGHMVDLPEYSEDYEVLYESDEFKIVDCIDMDPNYYEYLPNSYVESILPGIELPADCTCMMVKDDSLVNPMDVYQKFRVIVKTV